jgi:hypothetical protein
MASPSAFSSSRRVDSQLEGFDLTEIQVNIKEKEKEDDGRENGHRSNGHSERLGVTLGGSMTIDDLIEDTRGVRLRPLDLETDVRYLFSSPPPLSLDSEATGLADCVFASRAGWCSGAATEGTGTIGRRG